LGQMLGVGRKLHHESGLWIRVLKGDPEAVRAMVRYNQGDVELLERVFVKLRPFVTESISRHLFDLKAGCPRCGSLKVQSRGVHRAVTRSYARWYCGRCGSWWRTDVITDKTTTRLIA
jgi:ribosomal protein S27AE